MCTVLRYRHGTFTAAQLKIIQEAISISVFCIFCVTWLRGPLKWNILVAFLFIFVGVYFAFAFRPAN